MNLDLLREAAEWRLLSLLFEYPAGSWREQVSALLPNLSDHRFRETAEHALNDAEEGLYHTVFGPAGPVPPREAAYLQGVQLGYLMSDLEARYAAFGYQPQTAEAADHISVEAGFIAWLKLKQAYALESNDEEHATITAEAARSFIDDHLSNIAEPLAQRLEPVAPPYLVLASHLLHERVGSPPQAVPIPLNQLLNDDDELACGAAPPQDALIQLEP
jgi:nitrate reductase assembly molybdenum cofactor insertion protein NarJ